MRKDKIAPYLFFPSPAAERDGKKKKQNGSGLVPLDAAPAARLPPAYSVAPSALLLQLACRLPPASSVRLPPGAAPPLASVLRSGASSSWAAGARRRAGEVLKEELVGENGDGGVLAVGAPSPPTVAAKVRLERRPLPLSSPTPPFILAAVRRSHATAASSPRRCCAISRRRRRAPDARPRRRLAPSSSSPRTTTVVPSCSSPSQRGVFGRR